MKITVSKGLVAHPKGKEWGVVVVFPKGKLERWFAEEGQRQRWLDKVTYSLERRGGEAFFHNPVEVQK